MAKKDVENEYRSERKERLQKAAKQKNKKHRDSTDVIVTVIRVIACVVVVGLLCGALYLFGVPQKLLPAVKVGDRTYSASEYSYYYTSVYQTYANQAYSYEQTYGINLLGFDYTKSPAEQYTKDADGNEITYDQFFRDYVVSTLESYNHYLKEVNAKGITLSDESKKAIDDTIRDLKTYADTYGYSTDRYISLLYGRGLNEKKFRSLMEEQYLVSQYLEELDEEIQSGITPSEIEAAYNEDPLSYQAVDLRLFGLEIGAEEKETEEATTTEPAEDSEDEETTAEETTAEETTAEETAAEETTEAQASENEETTAEEEKEQSKQEILANEMLERITDEDSFIELAKEYCAAKDKETFEDPSATLAVGIVYNTVKEKIDEDLADWLFDSERQVGDKTVCVTDEYVYVIMMKKTAYRNEDPLVSARHILVSFEAIAEELEKENEDLDTSKTEDETKTASDGTEISNEGTSYSGEVVLAAYEKAREILKEYQDGAKTEESFADLAEEYSDDTGSVGENTSGGGLYTDIAKGNMVQPFEDWIYDSSREPGDTGLIRTKYGWHIMYFVSAHEEAPWIETIRASISAEKQEESDNAIKEQVEGTATLAAFEGFAAKEALKLVNRLYASN